MKFYSGFSLSNESGLFSNYIKDSEYTVSGFSYGAIKAFEYVESQLQKTHRIDTLQLFSPAFFQTKTEKFKRLQTISYTKNQLKYLEQFIKGCFAPYELKQISHAQTTLGELEELLSYEWDIEKLKYLHTRGVSLEVYLGGQDNIIDVKAAEELFVEVATVTYIKNANHFLQID